MRELDIIVLDTPHGEVIEISSSSCNISIFSSKASYPHDKNTEATQGGSSSASIGELWPDINKLDEVAHEGASVWNPQGDQPP
jgi:hypothetical protein